MNPFGAMRGQAVALAILTAASAFTDRWYAPAVLLAALLLPWAALNHGYAAALRRQPRRRARVAGDLEVARQITLCVGLVLAAVVARRVGDVRTISSPQASWALILAAAFPLAMYLSSLVDWYYVRPRRDGVVWEPPCRSSEDERWVRVTRLWYRHRCVAPFACFVTAGAAAGFVALALMGSHGSPSGVQVGGAFIGTMVFAGGVMQFGYGSLRLLGEVFTSCSVNPPDHPLGRRLVRRDDGPGSFVCDVAVEGVTLVPLNGRQRPSGEGSVTVPVSRVQGAHELHRLPFSGCRVECVLVNARCQWIPPDERRASLPRRLVVWRDRDALGGGRVDPAA